MSGETVVVLFAGPGGTCTGLRWAGWAGRSVGYDYDAAACATGRAAGHDRVQADVAELDPRALHGDDQIAGLISTPPCPSFSTAGKGAGRKLLSILATAITHAARGEFDRDDVVRRCARLLFLSAADEEQGVVGRRRPLPDRLADARAAAGMSALVVEPMRWVYELGPQWVMLEQVPAVLPLWTHMAAVLRGHGYSATAAIVSAEEYGVPQTRKRAILVASRTGRARIPEATHQPYRAGQPAQTEPDLFGDPLPAPVSMAQALGWGVDDRPSWTVSGGGTDTGGAEVFANAKVRKRLAETVRLSPSTASIGNDRTIPRTLDEPATTVAFGHSSMRWLTTGNNSHVTGRTGSRRGEGDVQAYGRSTDAPAPTLDTNIGGKWKLHAQGVGNGWGAPREADEPAHTVKGAGRGGQYWTHERPATTVCGDPRLGSPGHRDRAGGEPQFGADSVRVSVSEAGVLQSFPPDYPWQGTKTQQYRQVGDSVPPLLAAHCLRQFVTPDVTAVVA